jgi:uncharacterized protein (DUF433 family)
MEEKPDPTKTGTSVLNGDHVESRQDVCGGKPCVRGTRIRVWDVHIWHDVHGESPEEIVALFPQLSLADVHAALSYYLDNRVVIEKEMKGAEAFVGELEAKQGPTRFSQVRDQLVKDKDAGSDQIPSG